MGYELKISGNVVLDGLYNGGSASDLVIPSGITTIAHAAFKEANFINNVDLTDVVAVENNAFLWSSIKSVKFSDSLEWIGDSAFNGCSNLAGKLVLPKSLNHMGSGAFFDCAKLTHVYVNCPNLSYLPSSAFRDCPNLEYVSLHNNLKGIGGGAFSDDKKLTSIELPHNLTTIQREAFYGSGLQYISFPASLEELQARAFFRCSQLTNVWFSNAKEDPKIRYIGDLAFAYTNLETITIPASVTTIGDKAFQNCLNLTHVIFKDNAQEELLKDALKIFEGCKNLRLIYFPAGCYKKDLSTEKWSYIQL